MKEATQKSQGIEKTLTAITGRDRRVCVRGSTCATCGGEASKFKDALSEKEFTISGMCQKCQDQIFG